MIRRGDTREIIIEAAGRVFFKNGFEGTSVKMILQEAGVVTGSFYHFFSSKEALFEEVVARFLQNYVAGVSAIFMDDAADFEVVVHKFLYELRQASQTYYDVLSGDKLHWTVQCALHVKTLENLVPPLAGYLQKQIRKGAIESRLPVDEVTLAKIIINGLEAILHGRHEQRPEFLQTGILSDLIFQYLRQLLIVR